MTGKKPQPKSSRTINAHEVPLACVAFAMAHEGCGEDVELAKLADTLLCYCDCCNDLRTFVVTVKADPFI